MPLISFYDLVDDIHEFCYVMSHVLQLHELLNYSLERVAVLRKRITDKIKMLHRKNMLHEVKMDEERWNCGANAEHVCSEHGELKKRLLLLEKEVEELKKQFTNLPIGPLQSQSNACSLPIIPEIRALPTVIPPPPPPPPLLPATFSACASTKSSYKKKQCRNGTTRNNVDMAMILQGIKDVKLRRTEKSPGGTPLRRLSICDSNDPNDLIKVALKKRFEIMNPNDSDNKENTDDSWEQSPGRSFIS